MRTFRITVDGTPYEVQVEELDPAPGVTTQQAMPASAPRPQTERQPAPKAAAPQPPKTQAQAGAGEVASPLAATVVAIEVQLGQQVTEGQQVVVLEAMKMHSSVFAPHAGTVSAILVSPGTSVSEGQALLSIV